MATINEFGRPQLTTSFCLDIVVNATGHQSDFVMFYNRDLSTTLDNLGIIDSDQISAHKAKIRSAISQKGYNIALSDIKTGPAVTVSTCLYSVRDNAK